MTEPIRPLTETEKKAIAPLLARRAALVRELEATQQGLAACLRLMVDDPEGVTLDPDTMTLTRKRTPEDVAADMEAMAETIAASREPAPNGDR